MAAELNEMALKQLFDKINQGDEADVGRILEIGQISIDNTDETGMTPLMQACFKGNVKIVKLLLNKGADVNSCQHEHKYTPLMFACLSGSLDTVHCLLDAGADKEATNTLGRTASQLAAFTSRHECVRLINSYLNKSEFEPFTKKLDAEGQPMLKPEHLDTLQKYLLIGNLSPVKLVLFLKEHLHFVDDFKTIVKILRTKSDSYIKDAQTMNEISALKFHYFSCVLEHCGEWHCGTSGQNGIDGFVKHLVKGRSKDGFALGTEDFIRQIVREFKYPECTVFRQLVSKIAPVERGDYPTALTCLAQSIFGIQSVQQETSCCETCSQPNAQNRCSACKKVVYCDGKCQKLHWFTHKKQCKATKET